MSKLLCRIPQSAVWLVSKLRLVARFAGMVCSHTFLLSYLCGHGLWGTCVVLTSFVNEVLLFYFYR